MNKRIIIALFAVVILASGAYALHFMRSARGGVGTGEFPLVCSHCGYFFTFDEDEMYAQPKGPSGTKCPKCGQFAAQIASKCSQCGQWAIMQHDAKGHSYCPKCSKAKTAEAQ